MPKPKIELTTVENLKLLKQVAEKAVEYYPLSVTKVKFLTFETNTMFRVDTEDGQKYVLRIYSDEETTLQDNINELFWLLKLIQETDLKVTEPVLRQDGAYLTRVKVPDSPEEKRCVLFKWIPGSCLERNLTPQRYYKLGQIMAQLHDHAQSLELPAHVVLKKWDRVFYYPDEPVVFDQQEYQHLFSADRIDIMKQVIALADKLLEELYSNSRDQIIIHGDLHYANVHLHNEQLYIIDFEDVMAGYPVQDLAVTLYYGRDRENFQELYSALKQGYQSIRSWPSGSPAAIETLVAARAANFINYVARVQHNPASYIGLKIEQLRDFLRNYHSKIFLTE